MAKVFLTRQQRLTVPYFRKYVIKNNIALLEDQDDSPPEPFYKKDALIRGLNLDSDATPWDKRLLYEVTGLRFNDYDYRDESSDDEINNDPKKFMERARSLRGNLIRSDSGYETSLLDYSD